MNKLKKALLGLSKKDRNLLEPVFDKLRKGNTKGLDIVPVEGKNRYRIKKGRWRIFATKVGRAYNVTFLKKRDEKTYR